MCEESLLILVNYSTSNGRLHSSFQEFVQSANTRTSYGGVLLREGVSECSTTREKQRVGKWEGWCSRTATGAVVALATTLIRRVLDDFWAPQRRVSPRGRAHPPPHLHHLESWGCHAAADKYLLSLTAPNRWQSRCD
jgi:hypothetical protein